MSAIFKKGTKSDPGNDRPVSLTCVACKLLESFVRNAVVDHRTDNNLYSECQHGFRKHTSCVTQLLEVIEDFTQQIDNGYPVVVYLDFKKAFDTVPHQRLMCKLASYGIVSNVYNWSEDFLSNRSQGGKDWLTNADVLNGIP